MAKLTHLLLAGAAALSSLTAAGSARAATVVGPPATVRPCTDFTFNVTITACAGGYSGNLLQASLTDPTGLQAVAALGGSGGTFIAPKLENLSSTLGIINFNTTLTGPTIFGFHAGGAGDGGEGTFFFSFDAGTGTNVIQITSRLNANETGLSDAALFQTGGGTPRSATPEPATWTMMLIGFGLIGYGLRRRRQISVRLRLSTAPLESLSASG